MSDCEAEELVWESLFSSGKKKRKKKGKRSPKKKNRLTEKPKDNAPNKKKKNVKFKEAMEERKAKRKEKKKKKKEKLLAKLHNKIVNDHSLSSCSENKTEYTEQLTAENTTQDPNKKSKRKKQVAFDLPHSYNRVKRPKFTSSFLLPTNSTSPVSRFMGDTEVIEPSQSQAKTNDSQSTSDDMHSQDLFITQKTFRVPLSEVSSEEASDRAEDTTKVTGIFYRETKEESVLFKTQKIKISSDKTGFSQGKVKSSPTNPYLDEPIVVSSSPEKTTKHCTVLSHPDQQQRSMTSSITQTENFFTTELTLYLSFCQKNKSNAHSDELKPLDLSLPNRARRALGSCVVTKDLHEETDIKSNLTEVLEGGPGQRSWSMSAQGKGETTPSPQSESEHKPADTTMSSEDTEAPNHTTRLDLMQVRAVQMRLNESFFFKTKGEGPSPRPESPLMKLVQGREAKSRKTN